MPGNRSRQRREPQPVTRKGGKVVTIPLAPRTARAIDLATGERTEGPLFLAADGRRLDRHGAARIVRRVTRRAGIAKHVGPHTLRHAFITAALDAGIPLRDVQEAASHADPRTTMRYDRARTSLDRHATYIVATYVAGQRDSEQARPWKAVAATGGPCHDRRSTEVITRRGRWQRPRTALGAASRVLRCRFCGIRNVLLCGLRVVLGSLDAAGGRSCGRAVGGDMCGRLFGGDESTGDSGKRCRWAFGAAAGMARGVGALDEQEEGIGKARRGG